MKRIGFFLVIIISSALHIYICAEVENVNANLINIQSRFLQGKDIEYLQKSANSTLTKTMNLYKFSIKDKIDIIVTQDLKEFKELTSHKMPDWVAGIALIRPHRIIISGNFINRFPDDINGIINHEISHIVLEEKFASMSGTRPPGWLDEGLAMYVSRSWDLDYLWQESNIKILYTAVHQNKMFPFSHLAYSFPADEELVRIAYAQCYHFIVYLVSKYSFEKLMLFVNYLSTGKDIESSSQEIFKKSFFDIEKDWVLNLKRKKILFTLVFGTSNFYTILWSLLGIMVIIIFFRRIVFKKKRKFEEEDYDENEKEGDFHGR